MSNAWPVPLACALPHIGRVTVARPHIQYSVDTQLITATKSQQHLVLKLLPTSRPPRKNHWFICEWGVTPWWNTFLSFNWQCSLWSTHQLYNYRYNCYFVWMDSNKIMKHENWRAFYTENCNDGFMLPALLYTTHKKRKLHWLDHGVYQVGL